MNRFFLLLLFMVHLNIKKGILFLMLLLQSLGYAFVSGDLASDYNILLFIMTYLAIENENNIQTKKLSKIDKI